MSELRFTPREGAFCSQGARECCVSALEPNSNWQQEGELSSSLGIWGGMWAPVPPQRTGKGWEEVESPPA